MNGPPDAVTPGGPRSQPVFVGDTVMAAGQHSTSPPTPQSECHSGIYAIRCKPTGKVYVGSAARITKRWNDHRQSLASGKHHSVLLQRAWEKYGPDAFEFTVLAYCAP